MGAQKDFWDDRGCEMCCDRAFRWKRTDAEGQGAAGAHAEQHQGRPPHDEAEAHLLGGGLWERHTELNQI